jgi:hypothetical protein
MKKLIALALAFFTLPVFAAVVTNPGSGVKLVGDTYRVHVAATISSSSSITITGISGRQVDLIVNAKGTFTGSPSLTYTLQEVDPGDGTTVIGSAFAGTAITVAGAQVVTLPAIAGDVVKVSWTFTGTSITLVNATLRAKSVAGLAGQQIGAKSTPVVLPSDWSEQDRTNSGTLSAACTDANIQSCGSFAGSTVVVDQTGYPGSSALFVNSSFSCTLKTDVSSGGSVWTPSRFVNFTTGQLVDQITYTSSSASENYGVIVPMGVNQTRVRCSTTPSGTSAVTMRASFSLGFQAVVDLVADSNASGGLSVQCSDASINSCLANSTVQVALSGQSAASVKLINATFTCLVKADFSSDGGSTWDPGFISDDRDQRVGFVNFTADSTTSVRGLFPSPGTAAVTHARVRCASTPTNTSTVTLKATMAKSDLFSFNSTGRLRTTTPSGLFVDPFDGTTVDVTNRWTSTVSGGTTTQTGGILTIATSTTLSNRAALVSKPSFLNSGGDALSTVLSIKVESGTALTNVDRFWGWATLPGSPTYAAPVTDGIGFKLHDAALTAVVYNAGSVTTVATLTAPTDGLYHRYMIARRADLYMWYVDNFEVPVAHSTTTWPAQYTLPIALSMVNNTTGPSSGPTFLVSNVSVFSDTPINMQVSDGNYPWQQQGIDGNTRAARTTSYPQDVTTGGSYAACGITGTMAAALAANAPVFAVRNSSATITVLIRKVSVAMQSLGTGFTAGNGTFKMIAARSFSASDTGGGAVTLTTNNGKRRTNFATSALAQMQVSTTATLTAGTRTLDATPLSVISYGVSATANATMLPTTNIWQPDFASEWPLVLVQNEGFEIQATVPATGTWQGVFCAEWIEVPGTTWPQ